MATHPRECALALAIPLTRMDFLVGLDAGPEKDFAKSLARLHRGATDCFLWESVYAPVAETALKVAGAVVANGVTVVQEATLGDLQALLERFRVITLVAHWRSAQFYTADFLAPRPLMSQLRDPPDPFTQMLSGLLPKGWMAQATVIARSDEAADALKATLAIGFNHILKTGRLYEIPSGNLPVAQYDDLYRMYLNRSAIDAAYAGVIVPGNRIEFFDQFHSIEEVNAAIPTDFLGVLDFTVCNSVLIGNEIKKRRQCLVVVNEKPASIAFRLVIYKSIIEVLTHVEMEYIEAIPVIRRGLAKNKR